MMAEIITFFFLFFFCSSRLLLHRWGWEAVGGKA